MLTPQGPVVIDWATASEGPPGLDSAMSALILAQAALTMPDVAAAARAVLASLLRHLDTIEADHLAEARSRRAANPTLTRAEITGLAEAVTLINQTTAP
ncbi:hypothetical protein [Streptomyces venezuelae]|uniref:hypothetical protein n=1 Tax=Streptomyces venezuelae TaxID=54571 RepID=UPI001687AEA4|nr:hypothetical protein [Streptomyces venezuelae]